MAPSSSRKEALPQLPAVGSDGGQCTFLLFLLFGKKHQLRFLLRVELIPWEYLERKRGKHDGLKASWWWGRSTQTPGSPDPHPPPLHPAALGPWKLGQLKVKCPGF